MEWSSAPLLRIAHTVIVSPRPGPVNHAAAIACRRAFGAVAENLMIIEFRSR
jgi:hypothetical protein